MRQLPDSFLYALLFSVPLAVLLAALVRLVRSGASARQALLVIVPALVGFALLDALLLWMLPRLGLSFGRIQVPLAVLWLLRMGMLVLWIAFALGKPGGRWMFLLANGILTLALLYTFYFEPFDLRTTRLELPVDSFPAGEQVRIVQISDLHIERISPRERKLLQRTAELQPDMIVLTGDYLNTSYLSDERAWQDLRQVLSELAALQPRLGVYMVNGSVEKPDRLREMAAGLEIRALDDEVVRVDNAPGGMLVVGVSNLYHGRDAAALQRLMAGQNREDFSLLLYHTPDLAETAAAAGVDLTLVGHTHGGQIRVPIYGAVITFSAYGKRFEQGLHTTGSSAMYVSRGLGMEGRFAPRARFLAPPELVVVDLVGR